MKKAIVVAALAALTAGCANTEQVIAIADIPSVVRSAVEQAAPGIEIESASVEESREGLVYEIEGVTLEEEFEIEVASDGTVLELEREPRDD